MDLVQLYSPVYFLHNAEKWFPVSVDYYLQNGTLVDITRNERIGNLLTIQTLYDYSTTYYPNQLARKDVWIETPKASLHSEYKPNTPVYAFVKETENSIDLYYVSLYAFNYGKTILGIAHSGDHEGDMEVMIIELKRDSTLQGVDRINRIYYGSHATEDGRWVKPSDVEFIDGTHPVVYVAAGGHGNYHIPGVVFRFGGLANDYVGRHKEWRPIVVYSHLKDDPLFRPNVDGWLYFAGRWGYDGVSSIPDKGWMESKPTDNILKPPKVYRMPIVIIARIIFYSLVLYLIYSIYNYGAKLPTNKRLLLVSSLVLVIAMILGITKYIVDKYA